MARLPEVATKYTRELIDNSKLTNITLYGGQVFCMIACEILKNDIIAHAPGCFRLQFYCPSPYLLLCFLDP